MSDENKWSISELQARYELEPQLADVFVEGTFDREVLSHAFGGAGRPHVFYEIDVVNVPASTLTKYGLTSGNKQRVIALSRELNAVPPDAQVVCLADRDLDHWFGPLEQSRRLQWTLYCSIEGHFLTTEVMRDILVTTGRARIKKLDDFIESMYGALKSLYCLRLADREIGLAMKWVALKKYLSRNGDSIVFDTERYITALLNANTNHAIKGDFANSYTGWTQKLDCETRSASRGHDYCDLIAWAMTEFDGQKEFGTTIAVERLFVLLSRSIQTIQLELH